jgi:hypothetical protein
VREGRRHQQRIDAVFALVALHECHQVGEVLVGQGAGQGVEEALHAHRVDRLVGRQLHELDHLSGGALDAAQHVAFPRCCEQDRVAGASGATGAADAVDIGLGIVGDVEIDHVTDPVDVEPARRHVGGDQDIQFAALQVGDGPFALPLRDVAVDALGVEAARAQAFGQFHRGVARAHEDDHAVEGLDLENPGQGVELVGARDQPDALAHGGGRAGPALQADLDRLIQVPARDALHFGRQGRREQRQLPSRRSLVENPFDVVDETHAQHLVRLVQHQRAQLAETEGAAAHVIHHATRRAHHHVHAAGQHPQLHAVVLATVDRQHVQVRQLGCIALERFGHLDREFARGREHQHLGRAHLHVDAREQWQRERSGLAGAGLRLAEQVAPFEQRWNGAGLDGRRDLVADLGQSLQDGAARPRSAKATSVAGTEVWVMGVVRGARRRFFWARIIRDRGLPRAMNSQGQDIGVFLFRSVRQQ